MNLYTLGYDSNTNLQPLNYTVKENLKNYLSQYRLVTDAINIIIKAIPLNIISPPHVVSS